MNHLGIEDIDPQALSRALRRAQQQSGRQAYDGSYLLAGASNSSEDHLVDAAGSRTIPDIPDHRRRKPHPLLVQLDRERDAAKLAGDQAGVQEARRRSGEQQAASQRLRDRAAWICSVPLTSELPSAFHSLDRRETTWGSEHHLRIIEISGRKLNLSQRLLPLEHFLPGSSWEAPIGWHLDLGGLAELSLLVPMSVKSSVAQALLRGLGEHRSGVLAATILHDRHPHALEIAWAIGTRQELIGQVMLANHPIWPELSGELQLRVLTGIASGKKLENLLQGAALQTVEGRENPARRGSCPTWKTPLETWSKSAEYRQRCQQARVEPVSWDSLSGLNNPASFRPAIGAPRTSRKPPRTPQRR